MDKFKFDEKERGNIHGIVPREGELYDWQVDNVIDAIETLISSRADVDGSSLPAPTQDGAAEEYDNHMDATIECVGCGYIHSRRHRVDINLLVLSESRCPKCGEPSFIDSILYLEEKLKKQGIQYGKALSELTEANQRVKELEDTILWALGYIGSFPERKEGQGLYWWRTELDRRSNIKPK